MQRRLCRDLVIVMAWFEHNATRICYEEFGRGESVLLLASEIKSIQRFSLLKRALLARYHVISAELPCSRLFGIQPSVDDAQAFVAFLARHLIGATRLVGLNAGGEVALRIAERAPAIVRSVITCDAFDPAIETAHPPTWCNLNCSVDGIAREPSLKWSYQGLAQRMRHVAALEAQKTGSVSDKEPIESIVKAIEDWLAIH